VIHSLSPIFAPGVLTPGTPRAVVLDRGEESPSGASPDEKLWMDMPARFAHPCPNRNRQGDRGAAGPPPEAYPDIPYGHTTPAPRRGLHPRTPAHDCPWICRGREGRLSTGKNPDGLAGLFFPSLPQSQFCGVLILHLLSETAGQWLRPDHPGAWFHDKGKIYHTLNKAPSSDLDCCWRGAFQQSQ